MTAQIIDFPPPDDDDIIPVISGNPLADADPAIIARRLGNKPWPDRLNFFNSIICDGLEIMTRMIEHAVTKDDEIEIRTWAMLKMRERIAETLDLWGDAEPSEELAALLFALSLNPAHREAARACCKKHSGAYPSVQFNVIGREFPWLCAFYNSSELIRPELDLVWKLGVPEESDALFWSPDESGGAS